MTPNTPNDFSPPPAQQSPGESVAAPAEVGRGLGTITCAACGSTNTESCCHPAEFCQAICNDCNKPLNADGSVWVEKQEPTLEQFQRWLEDKAHNSAAVIAATEPRFYWSGDCYLDHSLVIAECRVATSLLMQFKLEQGA